jgi:hypothetical protein
MNVGPLDILSALGDSGASPALAEITKALTSMGAGTDLAALTGGGSFRVENMDPVLASATVKQEHFKFFKRLLPNRRESWSILDQAVVKTGIGAFAGSANSNELGSGQIERQGDYTRLITELGTYFSRRSASIITSIQATLQNKQGIVDFSAIDEEDVNAALEILYSLEADLFLGDKTQNPFATTGLIPSIIAKAPANVVDMNGEPLASHDPISLLANRITDEGNWGKPSVAFMSGLVKADLDAYLEAGYRVNLDSGIPSTQIGVLTRGMHYSSVAAADGVIDFDPSAFLNETKMPVEATNSAYCTAGAPVSVTNTVQGSANPSAFWLDKAAGTYQWTVGGAYTYRVEACTPGEVSLTTLSNSATMIAGRAFDLVITASASNKETHYKIYRSRKAGTTNANDYRLVAIVKKAGATTNWTDLNAYMPGTSYCAIVSPDPASLRWVQMLPMTKIPFALNDLSYKWGAFLVGALRVALPKHHGVIKNIIPKGATWKAYT